MVAEYPGPAAADTPDRTKLGRVQHAVDHEDEMSDTDSERPRRASDDADGGFDRETPDTSRSDQGRASRSWAPADDSGPTNAAFVTPEVSTPIPPPAPALPEPAQPPEAGRRFSADDLPEGWQSAAPRRSAVSVSSPFSPVGPTSPASDSGVSDAQVSDAQVSDAQVSDAQADPGPGGGGQPPVGGGPAAAAPGPDGRRRKLAWLLGGVAAVAIVGLIIWLAVQRPGGTATPAPSEPVTPGPSASASQPPSLADAQLITAAELAKLRKGVNWTQQGPSASPGAPRQPECVELSGTGGGSPDSEMNHLFTASKGGGSLLQVVQAWPDANSATTAFTALVSQAGSCKGSLLITTDRITGFADAATALAVRTAEGDSHTLLFARTGRFLSVVDGGARAGAEGIATDALVTASAASMARQCGPASGTCPSKPASVGTTPPDADTAGWLALVDLPQVIATSGKWDATDPQEPKLLGSECENVDLTDLRGASDAAQRTYVLTNNAKTPAEFGIDEVIYSFAKTSGANAMVKQLSANFGSCADRTRTASVKTDQVKAPASDGKDLTAISYLVTQRISDSKTTTYRVGIAAVESRLIYVLATPSNNFDFSDDAWKGIVGRATQRATQFP